MARALLRRNGGIDALVSERQRLREAKGILQLEKGALEARLRELVRRSIHPPAPQPPTNPAGHIPPSIPCDGQAYREYLTRQICARPAPTIVDLAERGEFLHVCAGAPGGGGFGPRWSVLDVYNPPASFADHRDLASLPAEWEGRFALALCNAVLEHIPFPRSALAELHRVLSPGGFVYLEVAFWQPYGLHRETAAADRRGVGGDYWRATVEGLRVWAAAFEELSSGWADEGVVYFFGTKRPAPLGAAPGGAG